MKLPVARILTWPWLARSLHRCGQYVAIDSIKRALSSTLGMTQWQGCKAAGEQSRGWSGGSTEDRGPEDSRAGREAWRMAVRDNCASREAQRQGVQAGRPRGRDRLAACRLALSGWDSSD